MNMAADVSYLFRIMNGYNNEEQHGRSKSTALITRDLLGGGGGGGANLSANIDSQELDLDLQVPSGYEKRLDLKVPFSSLLLLLLSTLYFFFVF